MVQFVCPPALEGKLARYTSITISVPAALRSWKKSLHSYEWIKPDGNIKSLEELSIPEQAKRRAVEDLIRAGGPIAQPVLGIGVMDNIEIGMGRAEFLTLAAHGLRHIPVYIPCSNESDFKAFRADVKSGA